MCKPSRLIANKQVSKQDTNCNFLFPPGPLLGPLPGVLWEPSGALLGFLPGPPSTLDIRFGVFLYISTWLTGQLFFSYIYEGTSTLWLSPQTSKVLAHLSFFQDIGDGGVFSRSEDDGDDTEFVSLYLRFGWP